MASPAQVVFIVGFLAVLSPAQQNPVQSYLDAFWKSVQSAAADTQFAPTAKVVEIGIPAVSKPGNIHHLRGSIFVPGASLHAIVSRLRDYDSHVDIFSPTLRAAALCGKEGPDTFIFRYWLTPYMDSITETRATHKQIDDAKYFVSSVTTGLGGPGDLPDRKNLCGGSLPGVSFMKQLHAVWRYEQTSSGVEIDAEAVAELSGFPLVRGTVKRVLAQIMTRSLEHYHNKFRAVN